MRTSKWSKNLNIFTIFERWTINNNGFWTVNCWVVSNINLPLRDCFLEPFLYLFRQWKWLVDLRIWRIFLTEKYRTESECLHQLLSAQVTTGMIITLMQSVWCVGALVFYMNVCLFAEQCFTIISCGPERWKRVMRVKIRVLKGEYLYQKAEIWKYVWSLQKLRNPTYKTGVECHWTRYKCFENVTQEERWALIWHFNDLGVPKMCTYQVWLVFTWLSVDK